MQPRLQKRKPCYFCVNHKQVVDYKEVQVLRRFVSSYMKIASRRRSGLCSFHQRKAGRAIKQSRIAGLMGYMPK